MFWCPGTTGALRGFEGFRRVLVAAFAPALLLLSLEHAQGVAGIETKLMLQHPRRVLPNSGFMPGNEECTSDMLDFLVRPFHLCPHTEAPRLRQLNRNAVPVSTVRKVSDLRSRVCTRKDTTAGQSTCRGPHGSRSHGPASGQDPNSLPQAALAVARNRSMSCFRRWSCWSRVCLAPETCCAAAAAEAVDPVRASMLLTTAWV